MPETPGQPSEARTLAAALMFFTRLPWVGRVRIDGSHLRGAIMWFPLAGWIVGSVAALAWWAASRVFPPDVAAGLSLVASLLLTGAFHEDGWADVCDGFGGGQAKDRVLAIMKDPHIGAYGVVGLVVLLGLKWRLTASLPPAHAIGIIVSAHAFSRALAGSVMSSLDYARPEADASKCRPLTGRPSAGRLLVMLALGAAPVLALLPARWWWAAAAPVALRFALCRWFRRRIGGYTGDCLGAVQQLAELVFLAGACALSPR